MANNKASKQANTDKPNPLIFARDSHNVSRKNICPHAQKVLYRLINAGFTAYLVGGGVRDLLLKCSPKDFDISTDARPGQIKKLFRNCWLIGRRFRLAHIKFGNTIIETSTFRRVPDTSEKQENTSEDLLVKSDNTFGTPEEDAFRRDFTINSLFYDISEFQIIDYAGGMQDLQSKLIRSIGVSAIRFQEDPVRMLRAVRFAARLGFKIEKNTLDAIYDYAPEITKSAGSRLLEEIIKLFSYNSGEASFRLLNQTGLIKHLLPEVAEYLQQGLSPQDNIFFSYLHELDHDQFIKSEARTPELLFATLLYPLLRQKIDNQPKSCIPANEIREITRNLSPCITIPRRICDQVRQILLTTEFLRSGKRRRGNKARFMRRLCFPAALAIYKFATKIEHLDLQQVAQWQECYRKELSADKNHEQHQSEPAAKANRKSSRHRRKKKKTQKQLPGDNENIKAKSAADTNFAPKHLKNINIKRKPIFSTGGDNLLHEVPHWLEEV